MTSLQKNIAKCLCNSKDAVNQVFKEKSLTQEEAFQLRKKLHATTAKQTTDNLRLVWKQFKPISGCTEDEHDTYHDAGNAQQYLTQICETSSYEEIFTDR